MVPLSYEKVLEFGERALWLGESGVDRPFKASFPWPFLCGIFMEILRMRCQVRVLLVSSFPKSQTRGEGGWC